MAQRPTLTTSAAALDGRTETSIAIGGISVPDSKLAREMAEFVRDTEPLLLFHHSSRVYYWGALTGKRWVSVSIPSSFMPAPCSTTWALPLSTRANMSASK